MYSFPTGQVGMPVSEHLQCSRLLTGFQFSIGVSRIIERFIAQGKYVYQPFQQFSYVFSSVRLACTNRVMVGIQLYTDDTGLTYLLLFFKSNFVYQGCQK
ncbi:Hypothetical_protein [Hexamita inflata]|uniref:Hypothetical_protein n=1 Tax=Hexamita inflata TaxID=28002 RepID=A0AA86US35_9EUKA|nr:Hypothetical protein HINF_LOCUS35598 [Hexamita inflata]